ncbi:MAG: cell envelope integrity protein TolA, partial [Sphingopyxis sp.]
MRGTYRTFGKLAGGTALALALSACAYADYGTGPGYASPRPSSSYEPRRAPAFNDAYYTIDQADGFASAIGSSPPDYSFRYGRLDAWAWAGASGETLLMESASEGEIQYYFRPNASLPYLIRDEDDVSYGFDRGALIAVFGPDGTIVGDGGKAADRDYADDLLARARELLSASSRHGWDNRSARSWTNSFAIDFILNSGWSGGWRNQYGWDPRHRFGDDYYYWRQEEWRRRHDHADRFNDWRRRGGRNAPPAYVPPVVTEAPHTRPVLGDRAGPIMDMGGRDGPREGHEGRGGNWGGGNPAIAMPPAIVPPSLGQGGGDPPPIIAAPPSERPMIEDPRVSGDMERPRPRPRILPGGEVLERQRPTPGGGGAERAQVRDDRVSAAPQAEIGQVAAPQADVEQAQEVARRRQAIEDQQLRAEEARVQAEIARSRTQALEQAGQRDREPPQVAAPRYDAPPPRYVAPPPPPPQ